MNQRKKSNLPNKITVGRIVMIFIFLIICNVDDRLLPEIQYTWRVTGLIFAILAGFTDFLDGYIARKYDLVSEFGKLMDPLADKIFIVTTFIMLIDKGFLPGWVAVVVLSREFMVTGLRLLASNKGIIIPADATGKLKTALQMIFLIFGGSMWVGWIDYANPEIKIIWIVSYCCIMTVSVYSGMTYFMKHRELYSENI